jgi:hypothetical protein
MPGSVGVSDVTWKLLFGAFRVDADPIANLRPNPDIQTSQDTIPTNHFVILKEQSYLLFLHTSETIFALVKLCYSDCMYTFPPFYPSIASCPTLRRSQLIHLRNPLLELLVLALLVAMSLCL